MQGVRCRRWELLERQSSGRQWRPPVPDSVFCGPDPDREVRATSLPSARVRFYTTSTALSSSLKIAIQFVE